MIFYAGLTSGTRRAFLAGPFWSHEAAEGWVAPAHELATELDLWCHFATPGVFSVDALAARAGVLNSRLGLPTCGASCDHIQPKSRA